MVAFPFDPPDQRMPVGSAMLVGLPGLISKVGLPEFNGHATSFLQAMTGACQYVVYRYARGRCDVVLAGQVDGSNKPHTIARRYVDHYWRRDMLVRRTATKKISRELQLYRLTPEDILDREFRRECYDAVDACEQITLHWRGDAEAISLNAFRIRKNGGFSSSDVEHFASFGAPLLACMDRHAQLTGECRGPSVQIDAHFVAERLRRLGRGLTPREIEVCIGIVRGVTFQGIALGLGISIHSVTTYRRRAYDRLNISSQAELSALCLNNSH